MGVDRRKFARFVLEKNEIQVFSDDAILFGKLNDISEGGLSFKYTPITDAKLATNSINILVKGKDQFNLYHIDCRTIYDISSEDTIQIITAHDRRKCGIKFNWLKEIHKKKLEFLLKNYFVKSVSNESWERLKM